MRECRKCGEIIPNRLKIGDKVHVLKSRKFCISCSPFNVHNTKKDIDSEPKRKISCTSKCQKDKRTRLRERVLEYKGSKCEICGYDKCKQALEFHHLVKEDKLFSISSNCATYSWEKVREEVDKCILLCANCHREVEYNVSIV